jgi:hypothetical protein
VELEAVKREWEVGGRFGARNRNSVLTGPISVEPARIHLKTIVGGWLKWARGGLKARGPWNPAY